MTFTKACWWGGCPDPIHPEQRNELQDRTSPWIHTASKNPQTKSGCHCTSSEEPKKGRERKSVSIVLEHLKLPIQRKEVKEPVAGYREYQRDPSGTPTAWVKEGPCEVLLGGVLMNFPHRSMTV
jgi:hypothetical protein